MTRYVCIVLATGTAALALVVGLNVLIDPYRLRHPLRGEFALEPDSRVAKLDYLAHACRDYDAYFFGDSRALTLTASDVPQLPGRRFYNLSTPAENIHSMLPRLQFLLDHGCPVSTVLFDVSLDVPLDDAALRRFGLWVRESPRITGENPLSFYARFVLSAQPLASYYGAQRHPKVERDVYFDDGHADYLWAMKDGAAFATPSCGAPAAAATASLIALLGGSLPGFQQLARLSAQYGFAAIVWVAPMNQWERPLALNSQMSQFMRQLHAIAPLTVIEPDWDSPILADYHYWHDCGHFRREVFDQLIAPGIRPAG